ncbi:hypothetical protein BLIC_a02463 [Bifidobacterium longum subsp. infantis]|nr:hypothetical protein BLIC_a02463 [Bifidobacterium longum subsp. infantis]CEF13955.1 hypothetical protein BLIC_g02458 [Bifidobacterium longum subsp. infantis]CEF14029.1 hypothetical protein BLIC_d02459 [Bifidobacterium longum subsp. infantis]CEF15791.1 hypothetical protein BLIC_h02451 [Bifidobacterium longum subsp. infantis]CEF16315.1 hypothetical protein BLIC_f02450 [Bifidobacterium longum subsp. infantis]
MEAPRGVEPTGTNGRKATLSFPDPFGDRIILLQTTPDDDEHCLATRRNINGNRVPYPVPRPPQAGRPQRLTVQEKICGGHGPGETPGPIPNPEAKAWHGDGTALDRVWESSTPPHHTYRKPRYLEGTGASRISGHSRAWGGVSRVLGPQHLGPHPGPPRGRLPSKRKARNLLGPGRSIPSRPSAFWAATR